MQDDKPPKFALLKEITLPPAGALTTPVTTVQSDSTFDGSEMVIPAGSVSVKAILSTGDELRLVIVKVRVLTLPGPIESGLKVFTKVGCARADTGITKIQKSIDRHRLFDKCLTISRSNCFSKCLN